MRKKMPCTGVLGIHPPKKQKNRGELKNSVFFNKPFNLASFLKT